MAFRHIFAAGLLGIVANSAAHADSITYADFLSTAGLTFQGSAAQVNSNQVALTPSANFSSGAAFASNQFALGAGGYFSTSFQFSIDPDPSGTNANGFAFVLTSGRHRARHLKHEPRADGSQQPGDRVSDVQQFHDRPAGNNNLVGVAANGNLAYGSLLGSGTPYGQPTCDRLNYTQAGCLSNGDIWTANIKYQAGLLTVTLKDGQQSETTVISGLSLDLLSILGTGNVYAGFTGSTGAKQERVRLLDWSLSSDVPEPVSIALFGVGLAALGMVRGRRTIG
ncbi:MAG: PEP-CTERM sorting domain-containing protein [Rhodospirillales bacterium]